MYSLVRVGWDDAERDVLETLKVIDVIANVSGVVR